MILDKLKPNPQNPRTITSDEYQKLKWSISKFPQMLELRPIVYDENYVVYGGNMRLRAVKELAAGGLVIKDTFFKQAKDLTEEQLREFAIKDNLPSGDWDYDLLANAWSDLPLEEWGLDPTKWDKGETEEDEAPEVSDEPPLSILGEIYQLGKHRLMCGDATKIEDVEKLMNGQKADMIFTDPPYNIDYEGKTKKKLKIENDKKTSDDFFTFLFDSFTVMNAVSKAGAGIYVCHADSERVNFNNALTASGWLQKQCIIWDKGSMVLGRQDYHWEHEPILYGWKEGEAHRFYGGRDKTTVWRIPRPTRSAEHPTMKPIKLCATAINYSSKGDDIILDTFGGSGSTLIAAEQTNRICYMMELDPKYADVIRKRYWKQINNGNEEGWEKGTSTK